MSRWLSAALIGCWTMLVQADDCEQHNIGFNSELSAVTAAANQFNPRSIREDREYIGAIYRLGSDFVYTVTEGDAYADSISLVIQAEHRYTLTAIWHTHGNASPQHRYFSSDDTEMASLLNVPIYLADYTGYLKVYTPNARTLPRFESRNLGLGHCNKCAIGSYITDTYGRRLRIKIR